jgi:hypothetical protein
MASDLYRRALARAAEIIGGRERLAGYLRVDVQRLSEWSTGARPPVRVLQSLAELLKRHWLANYQQVSWGVRRLLARRKSASSRRARSVSLHRTVSRASPRASAKRRKAQR